MNFNKIIQYKNAAIHYRVSGKGPFVFLVHGFAEDGTIWDNIASTLENNYTVIIPHLPGSGPSQLLPGKASIEDYANCLHEIFIRENIEKTVLLGHSMGGYISLAFAEKYPGKLSALGLFHSSAFADDDEKIASRRKAIGVMNEKGAMIFLKTAIPGLFYDKEKSKTDIETLIEKGKSFSAAALVQYYEAMINRPDRTTILKNLRIPVLLVLGKYDPAVPLEQGLKQTHMADTTYVHILKDSAHMGMLEEASFSTNILVKFLHSLHA
ncbi:MAG: alpha/beta hydrolase [Ferruginibacter sp.]